MLIGRLFLPLQPIARWAVENARARHHDAGRGAVRRLGGQAHSSRLLMGGVGTLIVLLSLFQLARAFKLI
jgi:hypothetical protein